jgi:hypothetical protein
MMGPVSVPAARERARPVAEAKSPMRETLKSGGDKPTLEGEGLTAPPEGLAAPGSPGSPGAKGFSFGSESKERAYQMFREGPGRGIYSALLEAKGQLKEKKARAKVGEQ